MLVFYVSLLLIEEFVHTYKYRFNRIIDIFFFKNHCGNATYMKFQEFREISV